MNLDKISIDIRPRNSWQAFDLGCAMALKWWKPLMGFWLVSTFPVFVLVCLISPEYGLLLLWLCKPLFERGLLYIFSRKVFGENVSIKQAIANWPRQLSKMWFSSITWRRLSPTRGFDLAVVQLEGLTGESRARRLSVLHKTTDDNSAWWLIICVHWEMFFLIGLLTMFNYVIPQGVDINLATIFSESNLWIYWLYNVCLYLVWLIVAPIFIGGSFANYLNRRIILEAWDIELKFKKINAKKRSVTASICAMVLCFLTFSLHPEMAIAQQSTTEQKSTLEHRSNKEIFFESEKRINEILAVPPFNEDQKVKKYRWKGWKWEIEPSQQNTTTPDWVLSLIQFIAVFGEFLLWGIFAAVLALLIYLSRDHIRYFINGVSHKTADKPIHFPSFSKAYEDKGLPIDLGAEVEALLVSESYRKLLSLFLVTSLIEISKEQHLPLTPSMTEQECLRVIKASVVDHRREFMQSLIETWTKLAWAHKWPSTNQMNNLCENWKSLFQLHLAEPEAE